MHSLEDDLGEVTTTKEDEPIVQNEEIRKVSEAAKKVEGKTARIFLISPKTQRLHLSKTPLETHN